MENEQLLSLCRKLFEQQGQDLSNLETCPYDVYLKVDEEFYDRTGMPIDQLFSKIASENGAGINTSEGSDEDFEDWKMLYAILEEELKKYRIDFSFHEDFYGDRVFTIESPDRHVTDVVKSRIKKSVPIRNAFLIRILILNREGAYSGDEEEINIIPSWHIPAQDG